MADVLGIDIGGTGIKAAPVDVTAGKLTTERIKLATPHPPTPDAVGEVMTRHPREAGEFYGFRGAARGRLKIGRSWA